MRIATLLLFLVLSIGFVLAADAPKPAAKKKGLGTFTISKGTTYITQPLDKDGRPDYVAALNERLKQGVTPENNAVVLLLQAMGPKPEGAKLPPRFYELLGAPEPPERGEYFIDESRYAKEHLKLDSDHWRDYLEETSKLRDAPWRAVDHPKEAEWLRLNEKPLAIVAEAMKRSQYYHPLVVPPNSKEAMGLVSVWLPMVQKCRGVASALRSRAMLRLGEGDIQESWQDLQTCHCLGVQVSRGGGLIESLVAIAIDSIATSGDLIFLEHAPLDVKQLVACNTGIQALTPFTSIENKLDLGERFMFLDAVQLIDRAGFKSMNLGSSSFWLDSGLYLFSLDWDPALRDGNAMFDRLVKVRRDPDRARQKKTLAEIEKEVIAHAEAANDTKRLRETILSAEGHKVRSQALSSTMLSLWLPAFTKIYNAFDRTQQNRTNIVVAIALARYRLDNGRYPAKLDDLAPKYLATVPGDLFSGKPLIYKPGDAGYLLYSVGVNEKDDGGRSITDEPRGDDQVVRVPSKR